MNILITGSGRGIGRFLALAFARGGHRVMVNYRSRRESAERTVLDLRSAGAEAEACQADVSFPDQARALLDRVVERWGAVDGLVNNAGVTRDRSLLKMTDSEWRDVVDVNLSGTFWCLQAAARHMVRQKSGFIINVGSILGLRGAVGCANYVASKAGVVGLTKAAARELGRFNVRVNALLPGFHETDMGRAAWDKHGEEIREEHVLGRLADAEELGRFVVFLAAQQSVSGQVFNFDSRIV